MASGEQKPGAPAAPANDSIDELLEGLPADPMLPRKRARSIEEVKAAAAPISQNRRVEDKVLVSEGTDPRERARTADERRRRESSTFGTAFLQARVTREKVAFGVVMMLAVLGIYAFVRHELHADARPEIAPATVQSARALPTASAPITAADIPPPPTTADTPPIVTATAAPARPNSKASRPSDAHGAKPPSSPASASAGRTDVSRSL